MTRKARPAARLLILDPAGHILLFQFDAGTGAPFWATPGGACDPGESFEEAARREMMEETGLDLDPGAEVAQRTVEFTTLEGEDVWSDERYFMVRTFDQTVRTEGHTALEQRVMTRHRWWSPDAIRASEELIYPEDIAAMVERLTAHG